MNTVLLPIGLLVAQVLLPAAFLAGMLRPGQARWDWPAHAGLTGAYILAMGLIANWAVVGYHVRYGWFLLWMLALTAGYRRWSVTARRAGRPRWNWGTVLNLTLAVIFAVQAAWALTGRAPPPSAIDLEPPLRNGTFYVGQGGRNVLVNHHYPHPGQRYALDIVQLHPWGMRAAGLWPADLSSYAIYGATVYSPCAGTVVTVVDGFPDLPPSQRDPANPAGNSIAMDCGPAVVYLAHLQQGSIMVEEGELLAPGIPVATVGNSGNTTEPHLHIHAERDGLGVPLRIDGRFLVRNDRFTPREQVARAGYFRR